MPHRIPKKVLKTLVHALTPSGRTGGLARQSGLPPGTLMYTGAPDQPTTIAVISYDADEIEEVAGITVAEAVAMRGLRETTWIDVVGLGDLDVIRDVGERFGIDPLTLEDILGSGHRPKLETHGGFLLVLARMFLIDPGRERIRNEQVSILLGQDFVLTFQEEKGDVFEPIRKRLRDALGRIRGWGPDYLAYALLDTIIDNYFVVLERLSSNAEELERVVVEAEGPELVRAIYRLRRHNVSMRRAIWPLREVTTELIRGESEFVDERVIPFLRDAHEHTVEAIDVVESHRDMLGGLLDVHLTTVSNRMNEVMKVLTIIATIFVPLTFVVGVYGMNFDYMPELDERWAYPAVWAVMVLVSVAMLIYFRRKRWI
jgi:magnesium transporter